MRNKFLVINILSLTALVLNLLLLFAVLFLLIVPNNLVILHDIGTFEGNVVFGNE